MSSLVLAWCRAYTALAPEPDRERRRAEIEAHLWDAAAAGVRGFRLVAEAVRGMVDDLRWCSQQRRRAGLPPLPLTAAGSTAIAGALLALTLVASFAPRGNLVVRASTVSAAALLVLSWVDQGLRRRRRR